MDFIASAASSYAKNSLSVLQFTSLVDESTVDFMAFLTSFNQSFSSTWTSEQVYGRNDPIANFQGTQRTFNLGWNLPSANVEEAQKNMGKVAMLTKMLYPGYSQNMASVDTTEQIVDGQIQSSINVGSNALSLSKAPLIRLKFANLINDAFKNDSNGLLGYIGSLSVNPALDMGMFTLDKKLYPKVYELSIDFTVLHEHDLGRTSKEKKSFSDGPTFPFGG